jgi:DNA-binding Xre family transcriptional regulator
MLDITDKKYFSYQITERFFFAMDRILGSRSAGKVTAQAFGNIVGITSNNLNRIRNNPGEHFVTIEAIGRLCNHYRISAYWLLTGQGDLYSNDELATEVRTVADRLKEVEKSLHEIEVIVPKLKGLLKK